MRGPSSASTTTVRGRDTWKTPAVSSRLLLSWLPPDRSLIWSPCNKARLQHRFQARPEPAHRADATDLWETVEREPSCQVNRPSETSASTWGPNGGACFHRKVSWIRGKRAGQEDRARRSLTHNSHNNFRHRFAVSFQRPCGITSHGPQICEHWRYSPQHLGAEQIRTAMASSKGSIVVTRHEKPFNHSQIEPFSVHRRWKTPRAHRTIPLQPHSSDR